jgi:hypothetical protein
MEIEERPIFTLFQKCQALHWALGHCLCVTQKLAVC